MINPMRQTTLRNKSFVILFTLIALCLVNLPIAVHADELDDAKSRLLIGEQWNGYLGTVQANANPGIQSLVSNINTKRRAKYSSIAKKNNLKLSDVERLAAKKTFQLTRSGHMIKTKAGNWQKK
ncbi:MAG: YdbL family protein [Pseudomonadales bacterium]|nr:YdbL family protein [Pseudomonadales bacterium]